MIIPDCYYCLGEKNVSGYLACSSLQTVCTRVHGLHNQLSTWNIRQNSYQQDHKAFYKQISYHFTTDEVPNSLYREHTVFEHRWNYSVQAVAWHRLNLT